MLFSSPEESGCPNFPDQCLFSLRDILANEFQVAFTEWLIPARS